MATITVPDVFQDKNGNEYEPTGEYRKPEIGRDAYVGPNGYVVPVCVGETGDKVIVRPKKKPQPTGLEVIQKLCEEREGDRWFVVEEEGYPPIMFQRLGSVACMVSCGGAWIPIESAELSCFAPPAVLRVFGPRDVPNGERFTAYISGPNMDECRKGRGFYANGQRGLDHTHRLTIFAEPL